MREENGILKSCPATTSDAGTQRRISYCETKAVEIIGINCRAGFFDVESALTRDYYSNGKKDKDRQVYMFVYSFRPGVGTIDDLKEIIIRGIRENPLLDGYQAEICIHNDVPHLHGHILISARNPGTGRKLHMSKKQYAAWRNLMKQIALEYGYLPVQAKDKKRGDFAADDRNKVEVVRRKGRDSDIVHVYQAVRRAMNEAMDWDDFERLLAEYDISVERKASRKHLVFSFSGRKFRDTNLSRTFTDNISKETIDDGFELRRIRKREENEYEQYRERIGRAVEEVVREIDRDEDLLRRRTESHERGGRKIGSR